jgi:hypothetical protein
LANISTSPSPPPTGPSPTRRDLSPSYMAVVGAYLIVNNQAAALGTRPRPLEVEFAIAPSVQASLLRRQDKFVLVSVSVASAAEARIAHGAGDGCIPLLARCGRGGACRCCWSCGGSVFDRGSRCDGGGGVSTVDAERLLVAQ